MFYCDKRFSQRTDAIRRVWDRHFINTIGNWKSVSWWLLFPVFYGSLLSVTLIALDYENLYKNAKISPFPYLREVYCPMVHDCISILGGWLLPGWYWFHLVLVLLVFVSSLVVRLAYRKGRLCLAWWADVVYVFAFLYLFGTIAEPGIFMGLSGAPVPTALVGYGIPVIYTVWFFSALLPPMRRLWQREGLDFRPPPLKLHAGAGSAAALLGVLGVALGRMFGEMPHGNWGYFVVGIVGVPWLMYLGFRGGMQTLLTLAPWRIVLEAEAREQEGGVGQ